MGVCESPQHGSGAMLQINLNVVDVRQCANLPNMGRRRFGQQFKGPIVPFGSLVEYHPITAKTQSRIHQFGKKVLPGLFLSDTLCTRG